MNFPKLTRIEQDETHRLIPYRFAERGKAILNRVAEDDEGLLSDLTELEGATNDRLLGESGRLPGISTMELVSGFRLAHIVNASFTHPRPFGARFNTEIRGAWYAGFELKTSQAEVAFHRAAELKEIGWDEEEISSYVDYLADFRHEFHDVRGDSDFVECLNPNSYSTSQALAMRLLNAGSAGILFPSVRLKGGTCIACFRPPLVLNVREGVKVRMRFVNGEMTEARIESGV